MLLIVLVVVATSLAGWGLGVRQQKSSLDWKVTEVFDGDTIEVVQAGITQTVRLLGIDTPETHHPTKPVGCFGPEASDFSTRYLLGQKVKLEYDVEARDIYGRRLAYVILRGKNFNQVLLQAGFARLLVIAPNRAHGHEFLAAELLARRHRRGLWANCPFE